MSKTAKGYIIFKLLLHIKKLSWLNIKFAAFLGLVCASLAILSMLEVFGYKPFYINDSDSAPHGIYMALYNIQSEDGTGARMELLSPDLYYLVALPVNVPALDKKAGFNLIKVCRALPGTPYTVKDNELIVNGRNYPITKDDDLPQLAEGEYVVPDNAVLFLNDPNTSFDSRYLGPIDRKYVKKVLFYMCSAEDYNFWSRAYAVSIVLSFFAYLTIDYFIAFLKRKGFMDNTL